MKVRLGKKAVEHVHAIDRWWRSNHVDPSAFMDEFEHAVDLLTASPDLGAPYPPRAAAGVRRLLLPRSQHYLYYMRPPSRAVIRIVAVWSCYRGREPPLGSIRRS